MRMRLVGTLVPGLLFGACLSGSGQDVGVKQGLLPQEDTAGVKRVLEQFVRAYPDTQWTMMSEHYRQTFETPGELRRTFSKESHWVREFVEAVPFVSQETGDPRANAEVIVHWAFEGYEGDQTCHFQLVWEDERWKVDWFLC